MPAIVVLAFLAASVVTAQVTREAPAYSTATIVNAASNDPQGLAPYTIIKIIGTNLAWDTHVMQSSDIRNRMVPTVLPGAGVRVYVNYQPAGLLSVTPTEIRALIPGDLIAGPAVVWTLLDGLTGPVVTVALTQYGPGVFADSDGVLLAARENGDSVSADAPLRPGDKMVLHAVGLGQASPPLLGLEIAAAALPLDIQTTVAVYINDNPIDPALISNVGLVPGQPGVYQLTVQLPWDTPANPEVRVEANGCKSPAGFKVPVAVMDASIERVED